MVTIKLTEDQVMRLLGALDAYESWARREFVVAPDLPPPPLDPAVEPIVEQVNTIRHKLKATLLSPPKDEQERAGRWRERVHARRRQGIPPSVQRFVWQRDGGRCVKCQSRRLLEFDHIVPLSQGGSNRARNIQLLCQTCNRRKNNRIGGERR